MTVSADKIRAIQAAVRSHERHCEQRMEDEMDRLAMTLGLAEDTVSRIWHGDLTPAEQHLAVKARSNP